MFVFRLCVVASNGWCLMTTYDERCECHVVVDGGVVTIWDGERANVNC